MAITFIFVLPYRDSLTQSAMPTALRGHASYVTSGCDSFPKRIACQSFADYYGVLTSDREFPNLRCPSHAHAKAVGMVPDESMRILLDVATRFAGCLLR